MRSSSNRGSGNGAIAWTSHMTRDTTLRNCAGSAVGRSAVLHMRYSERRV